MTIAQAAKLAQLEALLWAKLSPDTPQHDPRTTISGVHFAIGDPVLERFRADTEPMLSSERDVRDTHDTDLCPPWFEVLP